MTTETCLNLDDITVSVNERFVTINLGDDTLYSLRLGLRENYQTALLRVGGKIAFYSVTTCTEGPAHNLEDLLRAVTEKIDGGFFYALGIAHVKTRKNRFKVACRAVLIGSQQIALRDTRLLFTPIYVRDLGSVNLDDTGDTMPLYAQLNALI